MGPGTLAHRMAKARVWTLRLLLGPEDAWGARLATGPLGIYTLALIALLTHVMDLASGLRMMLVHGIALEQNPLARYIMHTAGPMALIEVKLTVVLGAVLVLVRTARLGRPRLARNCLLVAAAIGVLGFASNLVG